MDFKELKKQLENKNGGNSEGFTIRGKSKTRDTKNKKKSQSKFREYQCFICHKEGHYKKDCLERNNKEKNKPSWYESPRCLPFQARM